uniref:Uncharacterized protein n=1 Tax=Arundo donax TaxID=35708 RepID=A0A0A9CBT1_ARUDO
MWCAGPLRS